LYHFIPVIRRIPTAIYIDPLDTTIRLKYKVSAHPNLITPAALSVLLAPFGAIDTDSIVISSKAPKKSPDKPPKHATALVPFKQIGDAFAAVCASGRADRGMDGIEAGWVGGKEPEILIWLKKMGKLAAQPPPPASPPPHSTPGTAQLSQTAPTAAAGSSPFSSFPASFVCRPFTLPNSKKVLMATTLIAGFTVVLC
jgi:DnaJ family protein C protein 17